MDLGRADIISSCKTATKFEVINVKTKREISSNFCRLLRKPQLTYLVSKLFAGRVQKIVLIFKCQRWIFITVETNWQFPKFLSSKIEIHDVNAGQNVYCVGKIKRHWTFSRRDTNKMYLCVFNCSPFMNPLFIIVRAFTFPPKSTWKLP